MSKQFLYFFYRCRLIQTDDIGQEFENGTLTGFYRILKNKEADMYLETTSQFIESGCILCITKMLSAKLIFYNQDFLLQSFPSFAEEYSITQKIHKKLTNHEFEFRDVGFDGLVKQTSMTLFLIFLLIFFFLTFLPKKLKKANFKPIRFLEDTITIDLNLKKFTKIGLILIWIRYFLFFFKLAIGCSIKTNHVVINADYLIGSSDQLLDTDLTICFTLEDTNTDIARTGKGTVLNRLYKEKRFYSDPNSNKDQSLKSCTQEISTLNRFDYDRKALFTRSFFFATFLARFTEHESNSQYWISKTMFGMY